ncbi:hypothetical protein Dda_6418 [Drechslerella dactyloides]|uniref:Uncharacterized protein n=1 Tax=Drechslerella dactyloides TaxID=74499 RepID=A0AAD6ITG8_DREDA|nr:hypothetical protein Dda_6418 [Drechslerella dactyloides]
MQDVTGEKQKRVGEGVKAKCFMTLLLLMMPFYPSTIRPILAVSEPVLPPDTEAGMRE